MPNFPLEETDRKAGSGALAGEFVFGNTVPATTFREQSANAVWHGLRGLIKQMDNAGDLMDANYAAALADGFSKIGKALIRAGRRAGPNDFLDISSSTGIASPFSFDPPMDEHSFLVTGNNGDALVLSNDTKHAYRLILLTNTSSVSSFYIMYGSGAVRSVVLPPSSSICMFLAPGSPSAFWIPVSGDQSGSFDIELRDGSGVLATGVCKWKIQSGFAHLTFYKPSSSFIYNNFGSPLSGSHTFQITGASNSDFPSVLAQTSEGYGIRWPIYTQKDGVADAAICATIQSGSAKIDFFKDAVITDWTGVCAIAGFSISYPILNWA